MDVQCDPRRMEQLKRMLKREVSDFEVVPPQVGEQFPPPTPLSAAASFGALIISLHQSNRSSEQKKSIHIFFIRFW